jgi:hypothetical protein
VRVLPEAEQGIAYGGPAFKVNGKTVASYAAFKNHLSYLPHSGSVFAELAGHHGRQAEGGCCRSYFLAIASGMTACSSSSKPTSAGGGTTLPAATAASTATPTTATATHYCRLLTTAQVTTRLGVAVTSTEPKGAFNGPGCTRRGNQPSLLNGISATLGLNFHGDTTPFGGGSCSPSVGGKPVPGLGDQACFCGIILTAKKGSIAVNLDVGGSPASQADFVADVKQVFQEPGA